MKVRLKPFVGFGVAAVLAAALCEPTNAAIIDSGQATLASTTGAAGTWLKVDWNVDLTGTTYTYNYVLHNPSTDPTGPDQFSVSFNAIPGVNVNAGSVTGGDQANFINLHSSVTWAFTGLTPGISSSTTILSFTSPLGPTWGNAGAQDLNPPSPWSTTYPGGSQLMVPVPEPTTYLAGALLILPFGLSAFRTLRSRNVA